MDLRKRGARERGVGGEKRSRLTNSLFGIDYGAPGEVKISTDKMMAINNLYMSSPSIQAARAILQGQLLSSGIRLMRKGEDVELAEPFAKHLESVWIPFAKNVIDNFLQYGFCLVAIDEEEPEPFSGLRASRQEAAARAAFVTGDAAAARRKGAGPGLSAPLSSSARLQQTAEGARTGNGVVSPLGASIDKNANLIPIIPDLGTYEVSFVMGGRASYRRRYKVFTTAAEHAYVTEPDHNGNINSPVASVFDSASFVSALVELALNAEVVRARSQIVTQPVVRVGGNQALDPSNLFFDAESRAIQAQATGEEGGANAMNLSVAARACEVINRMQTTVQDAIGSREVRQSHVPPEIPPRLFTVPEKQQVVPNLRPPEARSDLVDLMRVVTTIQSLAISVNTVLTSAYKAIYSDAGPLGYTDDDCLQLMVAPLSACTEVVALFEKGVIDAESAIPAALHSLGASSSAIMNALARRREADEKTRAGQIAEKEQAAATLNADVALKTSQVKLTEANAKKAEKEASQPPKESGGSSSSSAS